MLIQHILIFNWSFIGGFISAFIYDLFRIKRIFIKPNVILLNFEDILYWILIAFIVFLSQLYCNDGEIRIFMYFGVSVGVICYLVVFSKKIVKIIVVLINSLINMICIPIKKTYLIVKKIFLFKNNKKITRKKNLS